MSARHKGRKRALDVLYAADVRDAPVSEVLEQERLRAANEPDRQASWELAESLVLAVITHDEAINSLISEVSHWPVDRMPALDRALVRLAAAELTAFPDTPTAVVISEAGELASEYSTEESRGFLQGVLGTLAEKIRQSAS